MIGRGLNGTFVAHPRNAGSWIKLPDRTASHAMAAASCTARLTVDITPALYRRLEITAFQRGATVLDMPRNPVGREFPGTDGDCS